MAGKLQQALDHAKNGLTAAAQAFGFPEEGRKIGSGALAAAVRQGWKELGAAFGKAFPDSVQVDEAGTIGNITPVEVYQSKQQDVQKVVKLEKGQTVHGPKKDGPELDM